MRQPLPRAKKNNAYASPAHHEADPLQVMDLINENATDGNHHNPASGAAASGSSGKLATGGCDATLGRAAPGGPRSAQKWKTEEEAQPWKTVKTVVKTEEDAALLNPAQSPPVKRRRHLRRALGYTNVEQVPITPDQNTIA